MKYICKYCLKKFNNHSSLGGHSLKCKKTVSKEVLHKNIEENCELLDFRILKKYLIEKFGAKCMKCDWNEINPITKNVPIELDHIDGNSTNNKLTNLRLLCPNCSSLTPTYKNLNKGNGRYLRRKRYKEGKSY